MNGELSASGFLFNQQIYFSEFEILLSKVAICYNLMVQDKVQLPNNENGIRDVLVNQYINNPEIKRRLEIKYFIHPEVPEPKSAGRTDIHISKPDTYYNQNEEYYIIECKRLDNKATQGTSGLNAEYIRNGICRFVSNYYSSHYGVNAMIGFVVSPMDIDKNTDDINFLLSTQFPQANTITNLSKENSIPNFEYHYRSTHQKADSSELCLYHLMFDVSRQITVSQ
jgi:hypothetical protein